MRTVIALLVVAACIFARSAWNRFRDEREVPPMIDPGVWKEKVNQVGLSQAQYWVGMKFLHGDGIPKNVTNTVCWLGKAFDHKNYEALYQLALYFHANGDGEHAVKALQLAAYHDNAHAQYSLSCLYYQGNGVEKDMAKANAWVRMAAKNGSPEAMEIVGNNYFGGFGCASDKEAALKWLQKAADLGERRAEAFLAVAYYLDSNKELDRSIAVKWLNASANQWYLQSLFLLSFCYENGHGVAKDPIEAYKWSFLASSNGYQEAAKFGEYIKFKEKLGDSETNSAIQRANEFIKTNTFPLPTEALADVIDRDLLFTLSTNASIKGVAGYIGLRKMTAR